MTGDPERVQQVVGNLLDNATKASPPDGPVSVTLTEGSQPGDHHRA